MQREYDFGAMSVSCSRQLFKIRIACFRRLFTLESLQYVQSERMSYRSCRNAIPAAGEKWSMFFPDKYCFKAFHVLERAEMYSSEY